MSQENNLQRNSAIALSIGVAICVLIIAFGTLSAKEGAILSLLLTVLSVLASWLFSTLHSASQHAVAISEVKEMHNENLRTYALKAAEKVNNLSEQLNRLSIFLEEGIEDGSDSDSYRIYSAIHMIAMLKSVNDTSLSDWQGVIGEEIEEHRKEAEEREKVLIGLMDKVEHLWDSYEQESLTADVVDKRVSQLKREMQTLAGNLTGSHINIPRKTTSRKREITGECPSCEKVIIYTQKPRAGSFKNLVCRECSVSAISIYNESADQFDISIVGPKTESFNCPSCKERTSGLLDSRPYQKSKVACVNCNHELILKRLNTGRISITLCSDENTTGEVIDDKFLAQVKEHLPEQPWPPGTHKNVAKVLNVSNNKVQKAVKELIRRNEFKEQIDGVLYDLVVVEN
ncbi:hypothetical protein AB1740_002358 [Vibrio fluvialis]